MSNSLKKTLVYRELQARAFVCIFAVGVEELWIGL